FFALILVIVIHEAAHYAVARAYGIKVTEFFVGFGPKLWSRMRGETEVGLKAIPAGGYVKIAGMNPYETVAPEDVPRTFGAKPIWQRSLVILAGPATHFVLAFICFALWLGFVGQPTLTSPLVVLVPRSLDGVPGPAFAAGLQVGDRIVAVDEVRAPTTDQLRDYTQRHVREPVSITGHLDARRADAPPRPATGPPRARQAGACAVGGRRRAGGQDRRGAGSRVAGYDGSP